MPKPIVIVAGTRPELIKVAGVYRALKASKQPFQLWLTGQHTSLAEGPVEFFGLRASQRWRMLRTGQTSNVLLARLLKSLDEALVRVKPRAVIVQGDTTTALAAGLAAFHHGIPVAHVEAGLRTGDLAAPFPEEMNRRAIDAFARWMFPPTKGALENLRREGHRRIEPPTGNTGIDALHWARELVRARDHWPAGVPRVARGEKLVLSTAHRRESLGDAQRAALTALAEEIARTPGARLVHARHPNPVANRVAEETLSGRERVHLVPALAYPDFVALLDRAAVVVSDSGGVQEEAPSFGIPILITRDVTERPEVLRCGGKLVGTDPARIRRELRAALARAPAADPDRAPRPLRKTPFGDGHASERIVRAILGDLSRR